MPDEYGFSCYCVLFFVISECLRAKKIRSQKLVLPADLSKNRLFTCPKTVISLPRLLAENLDEG